MALPYQNSFPLSLENDEDRYQSNKVFIVNPQPSSSSNSSSSLSCPISPIIAHDHGLQQSYYTDQSHQSQLQQEAPLRVGNETESGFSFTICKKEDRRERLNENGSSIKWMSSKMRVMRKMMNNSSDRTGLEPQTRTRLQRFENEKQGSHLGSTYSSNSSNNSNNITIRVCSDCNTTKTPLWRSGPRGPKSLCNACGIRQRKARRATAAAATENGTIVTNEIKPITIKTNKENKRSNQNGDPQVRKKCKISSSLSTENKKLCFEDITVRLSNNSAFQRVFPQDEKEAAILLMSLSYGLVHG